ncbi:hypothetical protein BKA69DRAFT_916630 [Paraphysoderma sedebokerense]|nr:hypothetical protein BKA69DRAFT_916630 [Paraphysoderma sedebokerense]
MENPPIDIVPADDLSASAQLPSTDSSSPNSHSVASSVVKNETPEINTDDLGDLAELAAKMVSEFASLRSSKKRPPRPPNSYILFRKDKQPEVLAKYGGIANNEVSKIVGEMWRNASFEEKEKYNKLSKAVKEAHAKMYPDYKYQPRKTKKKKGNMMFDGMPGQPIMGGNLDMLVLASEYPQSHYGQPHPHAQHPHPYGQVHPQHPHAAAHHAQMHGYPSHPGHPHMMPPSTGASTSMAMGAYDQHRRESVGNQMPQGYPPASGGQPWMPLGYGDASSTGEVGVNQPYFASGPAPNYSTQHAGQQQQQQQQRQQQSGEITYSQSQQHPTSQQLQIQQHQFPGGSQISQSSGSNTYSPIDPSSVNSPSHSSSQPHSSSQTPNINNQNYKAKSPPRQSNANPLQAHELKFSS